jgi:quercetin dioxygenase-like cupin family protein
MTETLKLTPTESVTIRSSTPEALEVEAEYGPHGSPPPKHRHPAQGEHFQVLEGTLRARVDGIEHELGPGERIEIPRGAVHQMWHSGPTPAPVTWVTR